MTRVLLIAEACNPAWASVPLVGYNAAAAIARRPDLDVTVATHVRNRADLEGGPLARDARLLLVDNEWIAGPMYRAGRLLRGGSSLGWTTAMAAALPSYLAFETQLSRAVRGERFDVVHRLTPVSPTMSSPMAWRCEAPFILGPINGGLPWPKEWPGLGRSEREWLAPVRRAYRRVPGWAKTYRHAAAVIAGSRHTATEVPASFAGLRLRQVENGIDPARFPIAEDWPAPRGPFRFLSVGRLVPYKAADVTLDAFAAMPADCRLTVVGDGPVRKDLLARAARLGVSDRVEWLGWVPQAELSGHMRRSQALVFPSLREFGGGVALEAMASGLPSVIADYGGPAELVDEASGFRVPMAGREELTSGVAAAMRRLVEDRSLAAAMGRAAAERVRGGFTWDAKAAETERFYDAVLGRGTDASRSGREHRSAPVEALPVGRG